MNLQNILKDQNTNWKYIAIVVILAFLVGGGILGYCYWWLPGQEVEMPEIETPERKAPEGVEIPTDWKTYRNEEYGFEVKYPDDWRLATGCPNHPKCVKFIPQVLPKEGYYDSLLIEVIDRNSTTYQDWISGRAEGGGREDFPYTLNKIKGTVVGGMETEIFDDPVTIGVGYNPVLFLIKDNLVYKITGAFMTDSFSQEKFDQVLSTFSFLE